MKSAHLFIDYQNLHMSAHDRFAAIGAPIHDSLIHPALFANRVQAVRNEFVYQAVEVTEIHVFRGQPSNKHDSQAAARNKAQAAEWTRDRRVTMHTRPLRYPLDPSEKPREKGVDVMLAISFIRAAMLKSCDTLILASRDTDLLPALETAHELDHAIVEVAGWLGDTRLSFSNSGGRLWGTKLDEEEFKKSRDPREY